MSETLKAGRTKSSISRVKPFAEKKTTSVQTVRAALTSKKATKKTLKSGLQKVATKISAMPEKQTRIEIVQHISDTLNMTRVSVEAVFDELANLVTAHLSKRGSGEFMIPKLGIKLRRVRRKPTKKRTMVSPLTGDQVTIPAKPARDDVKISALKMLKARVLA